MNGECPEEVFANSFHLPINPSVHNVTKAPPKVYTKCISGGNYRPSEMLILHIGNSNSSE